MLAMSLSLCFCFLTLGEKIAEGSTNDDVINISGHPDDELEVEDLMSKLGFQETFQNLPCKSFLYVKRI